MLLIYLIYQSNVLLYSLKYGNINYVKMCNKRNEVIRYFIFIRFVSQKNIIYVICYIQEVTESPEKYNYF